MTDLKVLPSIENSSFNGIQAFEADKTHSSNYSFLKQRIHERKIDQFFHTDISAPSKRNSAQALIGSILGVVIPTILIAKKQNPGLKLNSLKSFGKAIDIEYGLKEMLSVGLGGVAGGLLGGLVDRKEKNKLDKIEEATFQVMNISLPAVLVSGTMKMCEKFKPLNNVPARIISSIGCILIGANLAVVASNKLDDKFFDKYNKDPERKFKKKDLIVHVDDLIGTLILAKFPLADKLHVNKILPAIFAWSGYHVGEA